MNENSTISLEDEKDITLEDILKEKNLYLKVEVFHLYNNNKYIIEVNNNKEASLKKFIEKNFGNLPSEFDFLNKNKGLLKKLMLQTMKKFYSKIF